MLCPTRRRGRINRNLIVGVMLFVLCGGFAVQRQAHYIRNMRPYRPYLSARLIPEADSANLVRTLALGWDEMASVFLWMRTIQDFGGQFRDPFALRSLTNAFWTMAHLHPLFTEMYDFGGLVIGDEGGSDELWRGRVGAPGAVGTSLQGVESVEAAEHLAAEMREEALRFFEYGIENDPDHYVHPYNAAYTCLMGMDDPARAVPYSQIATTRPDCPDWVIGTIPYLQGRSGEYRVALALWFSQLRDALSSQEDLFISIRIRKITEDGVNPWNEEILTDAMAIWMRLHDGDLPIAVEQLVAEGYLLIYPEDLEESITAWSDAHGGALPPDIQTLVADGFLPLDPQDPPEPLCFFDYSRFMNDFETLRDTVTAFAEISEQDFGLDRYLTVQNRVPECPISLFSVYEGNGTLIERQQRIGPFRYVINRRDQSVEDSSSLYDYTLIDLIALREALNRYHGANGTWPLTLDELEPHLQRIESGTGEPFSYDPVEGTVWSAYFDDDVLRLSPEAPPSETEATSTPVSPETAG